jgi:hypothetical protein
MHSIANRMFIAGFVGNKHALKFAATRTIESLLDAAGAAGRAGSGERRIWDSRDHRQQVKRTRRPPAASIAIDGSHGNDRYLPCLSRHFEVT